MALELQQVQSRLVKAKKDAHRLEKLLAQSTAHNTNKDKAEARAGSSSSRRSAPPLSPSPDAILGDWVAEERPRKDGGERTWALSRKPSSSSGGGGLSGKKETNTMVRSKSTPVGGHSVAAAAAAAAGSKGMGPRPGEKAKSVLVCWVSLAPVSSLISCVRGGTDAQGGGGGFRRLLSWSMVVMDGHRLTCPWPFVVVGGAWRT